VIVGRPSGAAPVADERPRRREDDTVPAAPIAEEVGTPGRAAALPEGAPREFQLVVQSGQSLSTICKAHYGSGRIALVRALAKYNGLADANHLRAGQSLQLPPLEKLDVQDP
jgi:nucleoid-associated protein YgaU